jgi:putative ABC transport system ATP-binding protein
LRAVELSRTFRQGGQTVAALRSVSLELERGDIACVLGRSGSGKSTLLHVLGCLERPDSGQVWLNGRDLTALSAAERAHVRRRDIGFVFQSMNLLPHLAVWENVALPLRYAGVPTSERRRRALSLLDALGLTERSQFMPTQLSGGEQQRAALARALVAGPTLLLADEPTGELDTQTAAEVTNLLVRTSREQNTTVLLVTHDERLADLANRRFAMRDGELLPG